MGAADGSIIAIIMTSHIVRMAPNSATDHGSISGIAMSIMPRARRHRSSQASAATPTTPARTSQRSWWTRRSITARRRPAS